MILPYSASSSPLTWYLCPLQQGPSSNPPSASPWLLTVDSRSAALTFIIHTRIIGWGIIFKLQILCPQEDE